MLFNGIAVVTQSRNVPQKVTLCTPWREKILERLGGEFEFLTFFFNVLPTRETARISNFCQNRAPPSHSYIFFPSCPI